MCIESVISINKRINALFKICTEHVYTGVCWLELTAPYKKKMGVEWYIVGGGLQL